MHDNSTIHSRDIRQRGLVPPERLATCHAVVIGVGAIGRQVALQLSALGVPEMTLFDDDVVKAENLAPQGYWPDDLGCYKVSITLKLCSHIYPPADLKGRPERFKRSTVREPGYARDGESVVFCCVDSITTRRMIWEAVRPSAKFFVDGRMSAEVLRVLASDEPAMDDYYPKTLFAAEEAHVGACTARSTIYTASIAAGMMLHQFTKWLRGIPVDPDLTLNLLAAELTAGALSNT